MSSIIEIKECFKKYKKLTIEELATVLNTKSESIEHIVDEWVKKGRIGVEVKSTQCISQNKGCSSCSQLFCDSDKKYFYWR